MRERKTNPTAGSAISCVAALGAMVLLALAVSSCADDFREAKMAGYSSGDSCLARSASAAEDYMRGGDAQVEVSVDGLRLLVVHKNAIFNCCLDTIVVRFAQDGALLVLKESEAVTVPCDCVCPYEVTASIDVPCRGTYVLEIYSGIELVWRDEIVV